MTTRRLLLLVLVAGVCLWYVSALSRAQEPSPCESDQVLTLEDGQPTWTNSSTGLVSSTYIVAGPDSPADRPPPVGYCPLCATQTTDSTTLVGIVDGRTLYACTQCGCVFAVKPEPKP